MWDPQQKEAREQGLNLGTVDIFGVNTSWMQAFVWRTAGCLAASLASTHWIAAAAAALSVVVTTKFVYRH